MKNVWIEGWRFAFAIYMVVYHVLGHVYGIVTGGYIGVDVFFVISGYLLAASGEKQRTQPGSYLKKRFLRLWPTYLCAFFFRAVAGGICNGLKVRQVLESMYKSFPEMFMLRITTSVNGVSWFVAAMLLSGMLLWAILTLDHGRVLRHNVLPAGAVLIYLRFLSEGGRIHFITGHDIFQTGYDGLWRAFAGLSLGSVVFTAVSENGRKLSAAGKVLFTVLGNLGMTVVLCSSIWNYHAVCDFWYIFVAAGAVGCLFLVGNEQIRTGGGGGVLICWLGGLAYPVYLLHEAVFLIFRTYQITSSPLSGCLSVISVTVIGAALLDSLLPKAVACVKKGWLRLFVQTGSV